MSDEAAIKKMYPDILQLLKHLISIPSLSTQENKTADQIGSFLEERKIKFFRKGNNIWCNNRFFDAHKGTILLNSHHDTVKPNNGYTRDPFDPAVIDGKMYGLGSNDAGGALVSLLGTFLYFNTKETLPYNLIFLASAEEENSGAGGFTYVLPELGKIDFAIVGEPTEMNLAIAEKGLLVLDCEAKGKAGHAAREEGINAIYLAMEDIRWFKEYKFAKVSDLIGPVKMSVTVIGGGQLHNMVPEQCNFVVDVRINELYSHEEILQVVTENVTSVVKPRSMRLRSTLISKNHPLVKAGLKIGASVYGSPTLSDKALMPFPALKLGPGKSERSHTADEFIYLDEIENGLNGYINILNHLFEAEYSSSNSI